MKGLSSLAVAAALITTACGHTPASTDPELFFPTKAADRGESMQALFQGPLVLRDGCVLVGRPGDYSVPVWWEGYSAQRDDSGRVVVRDGDGAVVAIEGRAFEMGGGYVAEFQPEDRVEPREEQLDRVEEYLGYPIPERCLGDDVYGIWSVGETEPLPS